MFNPTEISSMKKTVKYFTLLIMFLCFTVVFGCGADPVKEGAFEEDTLDETKFSVDIPPVFSTFTDPESLTFEAVEGAIPAAQKVTFTCNSYDAQTYITSDCNATISSNQTWLDIGADSFNGHVEHDVSVNTTGLVAGVYTGNLTVESIGCVSCDSTDLDVTLTITAAD